MKFKQLVEEMVTNAVAGGKIAGTAEAGDSPPVKKKNQVLMYLKRKSYGAKKVQNP